MPNIISCPSCQRKLQVPETLLGQDVQCPTCKATFLAQVGDQPPPLPAANPDVPKTEMAPPPAANAGRHWDGDDDKDYDDGNERVRRRRRDLEPHRGTMILVFGILSLVLHGPGIIFGPLAWILGNKDLQAIRAGRMDPDGEGTTNAGRICGIIGTALHAVGILLCCAYFLCIFGAIGAGVMGPQPKKGF